MDLGVGILRSAAPRNFLRSLGATILGYGEAPLLTEVFQGLIGASAHIRGRGFGLPTLREMAQTGFLPQLQVLTGPVIGEVADLNFRTVETDFRGTLFRWNTTRIVDES